jgi:hypothetical protein
MLSLGKHFVFVATRLLVIEYLDCYCLSVIFASEHG